MNPILPILSVLVIISEGRGDPPAPVNAMGWMTRGQRAYTERYIAQITGLPVPIIYVNRGLCGGCGYLSRGRTSIHVGLDGTATLHEMLHARSNSTDGTETALLRDFRKLLATSVAARQIQEKFALAYGDSDWSRRDVEFYAELPAYFWNLGVSIPELFAPFYPFTPGAQ